MAEGHWNHLGHIAVASALFALDYSGNLREVISIEQQEWKHQLIGSHCALGRVVIMKSQNNI